MTPQPFTVTLKGESATTACYRLAAAGGVVRFALLAGEEAELNRVHKLMRDKGLVSCAGKTYTGSFLPTVIWKRIEPYRTCVLAIRDDDPHFLWGTGGGEIYAALLRLFTTPLLPLWQQYLGYLLCVDRRLVQMEGFNCTAYHLDLTQQQLDDLVAEGLRAGRISIPTESACTSSAS